MKEFKTDCATIRIYGSADTEKVKEATERFAKKILISRSSKKKEKGET